MHCKMKPEPKHLLEEVANGFTCRLAVLKIRPELNLASWIMQEVVLLVMPLASQLHYRAVGTPPAFPLCLRSRWLPAVRLTPFGDL